MLYTGHSADRPNGKPKYHEAFAKRLVAFMAHKKTCEQCAKNPMDRCEEGEKILKMHEK